MQPVTAIIAAIASLLVLMLKPRQALCIYVMALCLYPQPLTLDLGPASFSLSRIVVMPLLVNALLLSGLFKQFKWNSIDTFVVIAFVGALMALFFTEDAMVVIERRGGYFLDTIVPYFAFRIIMRTKEDFISFAKTMGLIAIPLALMAFMHSHFNINPIQKLKPYYSWGMEGSADAQGMIRGGRFRAGGTFEHPIVFGLFFQITVAMVAALWRLKAWSKPFIVAVVIACLIGIDSTVSSGPMFAVVISLGMIFCFQLRSIWQVCTVLILLGSFFVEVYSDSHVWDVMTRASREGSVSNYRIELAKEALGGGMDDHWMAGYGLVGLNTDPFTSDWQWQRRDLTNLYIGLLARMGLLGVLPFIVLNVLFYRWLYKAAKRARDDQEQWFVWCFSAGVIGLNAAFMTVGPLGQLNNLLYMLIAISANMIVLVSQNSPSAPSPASVKSGPGSRLRSKGMGVRLRKYHA